MLLNVNNIELFYTKTGTGKPMILLHGNGESIQIFDQLIEKLKDNYTVYAIDSRGHGNSTKVNELDYESMAKDIALFIQELQLDKPILYGFSDGGIIGLMIAATYPDLLSKLIISGANTIPAGIKRSYFFLFRMIYLFTRNRNYKLMITQPNITKEELGYINIETLVLAGSKDMIEDKHTKYIAKSIPNSKLLILQGETHESYVVHSVKLYDVIKSFLEN